MITDLFLSTRLDLLAEKLIQQFEENPIDPMKSRTILVPNQQIGQWLLLEVAKRKGIAMGLKVLEPEAYFQYSQSPLEMFCSIYSFLDESRDPELETFLEGKGKRKIELAEELTSLFFKYGEHDRDLIECTELGFQRAILRSLFP